MFYIKCDEIFWLTFRRILSGKILSLCSACCKPQTETTFKERPCFCFVGLFKQMVSYSPESPQSYWVLQCKNSLRQLKLVALNVTTAQRLSHFWGGLFFWPPTRKARTKKINKTTYITTTEVSTLSFYLSLGNSSGLSGLVKNPLVSSLSGISCHQKLLFLSQVFLCDQNLPFFALRKTKKRVEKVTKKLPKKFSSHLNWFMLDIQPTRWMKPFWWI